MSLLRATPGLVVATVLVTGCGRLGFDEARADARLSTIDDAASIDALLDDAFVIDADPLARCGPGYQPAPGLPSLYRMGVGSESWFAAAAACEADGGHLALIDDVPERDYIASITLIETWIGYTDTQVEGVFAGVDGAPPGVPGFVLPEPTDSLGVEDCVENRPVGWNDSDCSFTRPYLCECDGQAPLAQRPWCDTSQAATCGDCSTACAGAQVCSNQTCM